MQYLITGATGFIGPSLVRRLVSMGHDCRCLVREGTKAQQIEGSGVDIVKGDITKPETLNGIADGMEGLLHLATLGHMNNFRVSRSMFNRVNVQGTVNIMNEALQSGVSRIVHCSSVAAMGICHEVPATEESSCAPHHPYGISKLRAEKEVLHLVSNRGLPAVIVRFSMVYGPGDRRDILRLTRMAKKGLFPKIGRRPKLTPLIHINDAVEALLLAAEKGRVGEIYLITNERSQPFERIRKTLQQGLGIRRPPLYVPECMALAGASLMERIFRLSGKVPPVTRKNIESILADRVFSIEKAQKELGFEPKVGVEKGLMETVRWYKEKGWL